MKWATKPKPKDGDSRVVRSFAWLPTECDSGVTVWLRPIWLVQMWVEYTFIVPNEWLILSCWDKRPTVTIQPIQEAA